MCPLYSGMQRDEEDKENARRNAGDMHLSMPAREKPAPVAGVLSAMPAVDAQEDNHLQTIQKYKTSADQALQAFSNVTALDHYGRALEQLRAQPALADPILEYELLAGREICNGLLGHFAEQQVELDSMRALAVQINDVTRQIRVVTSQVNLDISVGNYLHASQTAEDGLKLARQAGIPILEANCLISLGASYNSQSDFGNALTCHKEALRTHRELGNTLGEAQSLWSMADCLKNMGQPSLAQEYAEQGYSIFRGLGNLQGQAACLNILGIVARDQARARFYYEQSLQIFQTIGDHQWQANLNNNLGLVYWGLGLYGKARDYLEKAVQTVRDMQGRSSLASFLESLGRIYIELGNFDQAQASLEEGCALSIEIGDRLSETTYLMMLGRVALATGQLEKARDLIRQACDKQIELGTPGYLVTSLAWLGAVFLQMGDLDSARQYTGDAVTQLEQVGRASEYPTQNIWWFHYLALKADLLARARSLDPEPAPDDVALDKTAWNCLQTARDSMLAAITTLSDEGLRRNYLNKVNINREILFEWARVSAKRKIVEPSPLEPTITGAYAGISNESNRNNDQLKRLLDISLQMNATLDPDTLLDFVMDNIIELSGAERGFLVLLNEVGDLEFKVERGMGGIGLNPTGVYQHFTLLNQVINTKRPVVVEFEDTEESTTVPEKSHYNQRSAICLPLLRRSELGGMIYADNHTVSGRFSQADEDLLSIFANQAAAAIENARLFRERERRITELSILDEISRSLSSTLNLDELLETVYQQVARIFDVTNFHIATYQQGDTDWVAVFQVDDGKRQPVLRRELGQGFTGYILRSGEPVLIHSRQEGQKFKVDHGIAPVGTPSSSWMGVPLIAADSVVGVMAIQSYDLEELFDDQALNLFTTISAQVAVAIRNTRLYEEKLRANQELESFSYSVSHDLRAPIRAINGFSRILLEDHSAQLDENGKKHLMRVVDAGLRMGILIDDILRLSRVTRSEIRRGIVDLSQLAQSVMTEFQNGAADRKVEVLITPGLKVNADYNLMRIVLENLLGNAWKFTQKHPIARIELGVTNYNNQTTYFIRDDGAGFDMTYVNKLFGAFQRLHDSSEFEGTGIGLATVQRIIHRHGGTVWADAAPEKGATFYFTLPG